MLRFAATLCLLLSAIQAIASQPTHALIKQGQVLYADDAPIGSGIDVGPWRLVPFDFNSQATYTTKPGSVPSVTADFPLPTLAIAVNGTVTPLVRDASVTKGVIYRGGNCELQAQFYPGAARLRVRYRVKYGDKVDYLALRLGGVNYSGYRVNLGRDGDWDGHAKTQFNGKRLFVLVMDAREKYPRGVKGIFGSQPACDVVLHTNDLPNDYSREGIVDLRAYCTGTLTPALCPAYASFLTNDPEIKRAAEEIGVADQIGRQSDMFVSAEVWLSSTKPEPQSPLVFLDGFESSFWSKPKPGIDNPGLQVAEKRILELAQSKLAGGPRGFLYGDYAEQMATPTWPSFYRVRSSNHYFLVELAWRSFLRTGNPEWYKLARIFSAHQLSYWFDGQQSHAKGLLVGSGPTSSIGHWPAPDFMGYWCDGDLLWANEIDRWMKAFTPPTETSREAVVPMRMARVAAVYDAPNAAKWNGVADTIEARMHQAIKAGVQMTGPGWHPLAYKTPPNLSGQCPEGILSIRQLAAQQKLDDVASYIMFAGRPLDGQSLGFGPLGEAHVGLQLEVAYDYYRARRLEGKHRIIYGVSKDGRCRVTIEKTDNDPSSLRIALSSRGGDIPGTLVEVYGPDGSHKTFFDYRVDESVRFPKYPLTPDVQGWLDGFQVVQKSIPFEGPAGRYQIEVWGHSKICLHGPLSKFPEWQDTCGEFSYSGQDAEGNWPVNSVMVGN